MDTRHCFEAPTDEEAIRYCEDLLPITFTTKGDAAKGQVMEFLPVILTRFREEGEDTFFGIVEVKQWRKER